MSYIAFENALRGLSENCPGLRSLKFSLIHLQVEPIAHHSLLAPSDTRCAALIPRSLADHAKFLVNATPPSHSDLIQLHTYCAHSLSAVSAVVHFSRIRSGAEVVTSRAFFSTVHDPDLTPV